ncbi:hypothetical protein [Rhizobium rhododendri]|uniref:Uncharacterized protein n=1 Tax=Rhizobium rhododendri TaxID=2506430 RepID=A0ABY8IM42_9HYPH|nr:hypothetical protein [Rhizobium rhododendri]WFS24473.1 hypothetical protein PR018_08270 [Rhizobium rhododendri]
MHQRNLPKWYNRLAWGFKNPSNPWFKGAMPRRLKRVKILSLAFLKKCCHELVLGHLLAGDWTDVAKPA